MRLRLALAAPIIAATVLAASAAQAADLISWTQWGSVSPPSGWTILPGDFDNDGLTDLVGYTSGSVFVGTNTPSGFVWHQWATVSPPDGWDVTVGKFDDDELPDIAVHHPSNGKIFVGHNTGSGASFTWTEWFEVSAGTGWKFLAADFSGDGKTDLMAYDFHSGAPDNGYLKLLENTASESFSEGATWSTVGPAAEWDFQVGDFTHDGKPDLFGYHPSNGTVWLFANTGTAFQFTVQNPALSPSVGWRFTAGNFDGDSHPDIAVQLPMSVVAPQPRTMRLWRSGGSAFYRDEDTTLATFDQSSATEWVIGSGYFDEGGVADLFGYDPNNGVIWRGTNSGPPPEGYAWPLSARPGETIQFMASGLGSPTVTFARHKADASGAWTIPMDTTTWQPTIQETSPEPWKNGCGWTSSFSLVIPVGWPSGIYSAQLESALGDSSCITFIVKPAIVDKSTLAVIANVNTWAAYNDWGGHDKYANESLISFLRPNRNASPVGEKRPQHHLARAQLWVLTWLEDHGYQPDVYTDIDFHNGEITDYEKLVIDTHPEYWSTVMYDKLQDFVQSQGKDVVYLAGNGIYESVSYSLDQKQLIFLNGVEGGPRCPATFRMLDDPPRPERSLLGVSFLTTAGAGPFSVGNASHWIFDGIDFSNGPYFGSSGLNTQGGDYPGGGACGWEIDSAAESNPDSCNPAPESSTLPANHEILSTSICDVTYYQLENGGSVFAMGSITVGGSLPVDSAIQTMVENVLLGPPPP